VGWEERKDRHTWLSAVPSVEAEADEGQNEGRTPGLPLLLIAFVCVLAMLAGLAVVGVHSAVLYAGCPLGINGCNAFHGKEDKGFFLVRAVRQAFGDPGLPESLVYVATASLGALLLGQLLARLPADLAFQLRGGGTVQSLVAVATGERIPLVAALLRVVVASFYLGTGGSLGMEGPAIQVCTALATLAGWALGIRSVQTQSLLASLGFSCGFAASFNSPLAGILFAMEELQHVSPRLSSSIICIILVASVVSTAVVRGCYGNSQLFQASWGQASVDQVFGVRGWMLVAVPIGVCCSLVGQVLNASVRRLHAALGEWRERGQLSYAAAFALHGLVSAAVGALVFHVTGLRGVWGVGAESVQQALDRGGDFHVLEYLLFATGKLTAFVLGVSVRGPGDTLEPVLISGAFLGGMTGRMLHWAGAGPDNAQSSAVVKPCVVFGMVGLFASCFRFPLTPIVIVLELTGSDAYALILPLVLTSFTAITVSNRLCCPLLDEIMRQDGIDLHALSAEALAAPEAPADPAGAEEEPGSPGYSAGRPGAGCCSHAAAGSASPPPGRSEARSNTKTSRASKLSSNSSRGLSMLGLRIEESLLEHAMQQQLRSCRRNPSSPASSAPGDDAPVLFERKRRPSVGSNTSLSSHLSSRSSASRNGNVNFHISVSLNAPPPPHPSPPAHPSTPAFSAGQHAAPPPPSAYFAPEGVVVEGTVVEGLPRLPPAVPRTLPSLGPRVHQPAVPEGGPCGKGKP